MTVQEIGNKGSSYAVRKAVCLGGWKQGEVRKGDNKVRNRGSASEDGNKRSRGKVVVSLQDWKKGEQFC